MVPRRYRSRSAPPRAAGCASILLEHHGVTNHVCPCGNRNNEFAVLSWGDGCKATGFRDIDIGFPREKTRGGVWDRGPGGGIFLHLDLWDCKPSAEKGRPQSWQWEALLRSVSLWGPLTQTCHSRRIAFRKWAARPASEEKSVWQPPHRKEGMDKEGRACEGEGGERAWGG